MVFKSHPDDCHCPKCVRENKRRAELKRIEANAKRQTTREANRRRAR